MTHHELALLNSPPLNEILESFRHYCEERRAKRIIFRAKVEREETPRDLAIFIWELRKSPSQSGGDEISIGGWLLNSDGTDTRTHISLNTKTGEGVISFVE